MSAFVRFAISGFMLAALAAFGATVGTGPAQAQFVCESATGVQGATAAGSVQNVACGTFADASSNNNSINTAMGHTAQSSGNGSSNVALGTSSRAGGNNSFNTATGSQANADGSGSSNVAIGLSANARGNNTANISIGGTSFSNGGFSTAVGWNTRANFVNSAAFGSQAQATRINQTTSDFVARACRRTYSAGGSPNGRTIKC